MRNVATSDSDFARPGLHLVKNYAANFDRVGIVVRTSVANVNARNAIKSVENFWTVDIRVKALVTLDWKDLALHANNRAKRGAITGHADTNAQKCVVLALRMD